MVATDLSLLTGAEAGDVLSAAVGGAGGEVLGWQARQVDHRPGSSTTVSYRAQVRWGDRVQEETLAASAGMFEACGVPAGVVVVGDGEREVAVWRFPTDPSLPALAAALDRGVVVDLLGSLGVAGVGVERVGLRVRSYRPRRRAVVQVVAGDRQLFLKVVRPRAVADLHRRHRLLSGVGLPVPRSLGWTDEGLLVLEALAGEPMRQRLRAGGSLPTVGHLWSLLVRLPAQVMDLSVRRSWSAGAAHYAEVVAAAVPEEGERVRQLAGEIAAGLSGLEADAPTHGDFYEGQLLLTGAEVSGILDVDTVGPGRRADDLACLLAHADVLATAPAANVDHIRRATQAWLREAERYVDPVELRLRTAGVMLSLATGPHRVQEPAWSRATSLRVDAVERWVGSAARLSAEAR